MHTGLVLLFILIAPGFLSAEFHIALNGQKPSVIKHTVLLLLYAIFIDILVFSINWLFDNCLFSFFSNTVTAIGIANYCFIASSLSLFIPIILNIRKISSNRKGAFTDSVRSIFGFCILTIIIGYFL